MAENVEKTDGAAEEKEVKAGAYTLFEVVEIDGVGKAYVPLQNGFASTEMAKREITKTDAYEGKTLAIGRLTTKDFAIKVQVKRTLSGI